MSQAEQQTEKPRRILISRLSAHGDVVQTLPLLSAIKQQHPDAYIGWVVEASAAPLLEGHPLIDRLHVARRKQWIAALMNPLKPGAFAQSIREMREFTASLRAERYEAVCDVQGLLKSAIWPFLARIPKRYGYAQARENAAWFYTHKLPPHDRHNPSVPAIQEYLAFVPAMGLGQAHGVHFNIPPVSAAVQAKVRALLDGWLEPGQPVVALAPATRWASKIWPLRHWQSLLTQLGERHCQILLLGGPEDREQAEALLAGLPAKTRAQVLDLTGRTGWTDLYEVFRHVDILVGPDSAPLHIANAVGHPCIVGIFGPTAPGRTGPIGSQHRTVSTQLSCQPCFRKTCPIHTHACLEGLLPEQVLAAVDAQLAQLFQPAGGTTQGATE